MNLRLLTAARARTLRLPVLNTIVEKAGRCARPGRDVPGPDDWFRDDDEPNTAWCTRRAALLDFCAGCPALAACREVALRLDAPLADGDMVRGGMTGDQLATMRRSEKHRASIKAAIKADEDDPHSDLERRQITALAAQLRDAVLAHNDPRRTSSAHKIRAMSDELRARRAARRAKTGWAQAA